MAILDRLGATVDATEAPSSSTPNAGIAIKTPVRAATTGTNIALSGLQTVDGVALNAGDRVLVKDQTNQTTNGIYNAGTGQWAASSDFQNNTQMVGGCVVIVTAGEVNASQIFQLTTPGTITLGSTPITWGPVETIAPVPSFGGPDPWYDVKAYGAKGDNSTDDTVSVQKAINAALANPYQGTVFFPPGIYICKAGLTVGNQSRGIRLLGSGKSSTWLTTGQTDVTLLALINIATCVVEQMNLSGKGNAAVSLDTGVFGANNPVLKLTNCVNSTFNNLIVSGGSECIYIDGGGNNAFYECFPSGPYGAANVYSTSTANWFIRCQFDAAYPVSYPPVGTTYANWAANTAYTVGTIVVVGSYWIQCSATVNNAHSGAMQPTLNNYSVPITDNNVTWMLVGPSSLRLFLLDSGCNQNYLLFCDATGSANIGFSLENNLSTTGPSNTLIYGCTPAGNYSGNINLGSGSKAQITDCQCFETILSGGNSILLNAAWSDAAIIRGNTILSASNGIYVYNGPIATVIDGNYIVGCTVGINLNSGASSFAITGNAIIDNTTGIHLNSGTVSNYAITGNLFQGNTTAYNDQSSGTGGVVVGNSGMSSTSVNVSVGASPFTYTAGARPVTLYIYGGSVSSVTQNGQGIYLSGGLTVMLEPNESATVTYSPTAPTIIATTH